MAFHLAGRGVLVYVVLDSTLNDFRRFLERHAAMLRAWTVRVVMPMQFRDMAQEAKQAFFMQLVVPAVSQVKIDAIRQRFKDVRTQHDPFEFGPTDRYVEDRDHLAAPRYHVLFKVRTTGGCPGELNLREHREGYGVGHRYADGVSDRVVTSSVAGAGQGPPRSRRRARASSLGYRGAPRQSSSP